MRASMKKKEKGRNQSRHGEEEQPLNRNKRQLIIFGTVSKKKKKRYQIDPRLRILLDIALRILLTLVVW